MIKMYIGDEEVVSNQKFTIKQEMQNTSSTTLNNCYPVSWENDHDYVSRFYYPKDYSLCRLYKDDNLIFAGIVENSGNITLNPRYPKYSSLQILGFETFLSEGQTLDFVITDKTVEQALDQVIQAISDYGFVKGNVKIEDTSKIGAYSTQDKAPYDVLNYLCDISGCRWFTHMVNENTIAIDMYTPELMEQGKQIDYTQEYFEENQIEDISFSYSSRDYRNRQVITSDQVLAGIEYTENVYADGYNTQFSTQAPIGNMVSIEINGQTAEIASQTEKELGVAADVYYKIQETSIETDTLQPAGTKITINYYPLVQGRQVVNNIDEINRVENSLNRKGVIARYENRNDSTSSNELYKIGQSYIKFKGTPEITLTVKTLKPLWNLGEVVHFNAPLEELTTDYMVKSCSIDIIASIDYVFYTYEMSSSFNSERAINYFDNQRSKNAGNLSEGDFITRNIDIQNTANIIFDKLQISEFNIDNTSALDTPIERPLT